MTIKLRLKELRIKQGLTQRELAELLGVTENTVANLESGRNGTRKLLQAISLCLLLQCKPNDLFEIAL